MISTTANSSQPHTTSTVRGFLLAALSFVALIASSTAIGPLMGARSVAFRPPVEVHSVEIGQSALTLTVKNNAQYRLRAEYGYALYDQQGTLLFEAAPLDGGTIEARQEMVYNVTFPTGVQPGDWKVSAWARERVAYLEQAVAEDSALEEPRAIVRRAPMSIEQVHVTPGSTNTAIDVSLRLTGSTQVPITVRYALSIVRALENENGSITPVERVYLGDFVQLELVPEEARDVDARIETVLTPGQYAVTLWVQRQTDESGAFEHFAQFTYPELIAVDGS
ncbi:MAG: hypothetical protein IPK19_03575 [Chloroflexi bacterium]|nr:hypothetical protein [Chloroflexota bacterium]